MLYKTTNILFLIVLTTITACTYNPLNRTNHLTGNPAETVAGGAIAFGSASALGATTTPLLGIATVGGASIGYYMSSIRYDAAGIYNAGGQVYAIGDYLSIEIPANSVFDDNTYDITQTGDAALRSAAKVLKRIRCQNIMVSGNSSGFSTERFEQKITEHRAKEVSNFLWAQGINNFKKNSNDTRKLNYVGYGNYFPVANNITEKGINANRRIQITAYPSKDQLLISQKQSAFDNISESSSPTINVASTTKITTEPDNYGLYSADMED
ncbi:OmpA family protein [Gammaproteobacteria bacterium]|nr:OmpA family protein [Gammaproteobacteria bacterium]